MKIMKKKIILISILLLAGLFFDRLFTYIIFEYNDHFFTHDNFRSEMTEHLRKYDYNSLILGSSRTYEGIHPDLIRSKMLIPFKWSFAGFGPKYNYYFYKLYKKVKGKPEVVIFGIDYFFYSLFSSPSAIAELDTDEDLKLKINYFKPAILLLKNKTKIDIIIKDIINSVYPSDNSASRDIDRIQEYKGTKKSEFKNVKVHTERTKKYKGSAFTKPPGTEGEYFIQFLEELKTDKVKIILVVIPEYIGTFRTNRFKMAFRRHLRTLKRTYNNIIVLNYNYRKRFDLKDEKLFIDGGYGYTNSHLSEKGSEIFNRMLKSDLKLLGY